MRSNFIRALFCVGLLAFMPAQVSAVIGVGQQMSFQFKAVTGQTISTEQLKGKLVVVDFWATWCGPCMQMVPHMVELNQRYGTKGLQIVGISLDQDRGQMVQVTQQRGMTWPEYFDGLVWNNKIWKQYGSNGIPFTVLLSPEGTVLFAGHPASGLDQAIEKAFREHPPQLVDPRLLSQATQQLDQVEEKIQAGDSKEAIRLLGKVPLAATLDEAFATRVTAVQKKLEDAADSMLSEVKTQIDGKEYTQAVPKLKQLADALAGLPASAKAKKMLNDLMSNPDARAAIDAQEQGVRADAALKAALDLQAQKKDEAAYARFKDIAKAFAGTDAAAKAQEQVQQYEKDPAFVQYITEKATTNKARAALSMAANYKEAGRTDLARKKYQSVIDEFPGTAYAEQAKKGLSELDQ